MLLKTLPFAVLSASTLVAGSELDDYTSPAPRQVADDSPANTTSSSCNLDRTQPPGDLTACGVRSYTLALDCSAANGGGGEEPLERQLYPPAFFPLGGIKRLLSFFLLSLL
jgi:hypothetical protein